MKPIFAIKDRAVDGFGDLFVQPSTQHAIRFFADLVNDTNPTSMIAKHPDDFDLYSVGTYDESNALINVSAVSLVSRGKDLIVKVNS